VSDPQRTVGSLRRSPLFARVDDVAFERCVALLRTRQYRRGDTIFHQGDMGDSLHVIESGSVKIVLPSPEGEEEAIIATLGPGDFFGELSLLDGEERSATAIAQEATVTSILRRDVFESLLESDRGLRRALFEGMAAEIRRLTHHVAELHFLNLPGRLARRVVRLAQQADPKASGEVRLPWTYSQTELASMIGGTRQSVNRLLADFVAEGLIRFERDTLIVPDLDRLARAAER
jgi:CRP/FNR family cyclic AMP-dependent transcriptional regulator